MDNQIGEKGYDMSIENYLKPPRQVVEELSETLRKHNYFYHVLDAPIIEDVTYDALYRSLKELETKYPNLLKADSPTQVVGHAVYDSHFTLAKHIEPMLSLDNVYSADELVDWIISIWEQGTEIVPEWKMDGLSLDLLYENGVLVKAITRGDGETGEDVTPNALMCEGIPRVLQEFSDPLISVRGEVVVRLKDYKAINDALEANGKKIFANPRNYAAGSLRQKDPKGTKERKLVFVAYSKLEHSEVSFPKVEFGSWAEEQSFFETNGFFTANAHDGFDYDAVPGMPTKIPQLVERLHLKRPDHEFEVDGLVFKVVSHKTRQDLGFTSKFPRWARALKFPASRGRTTVLGVDRQVGRTGKLTPVARIAPVHVHGTMISNVTLHNLSEVEKHGLYVGCEVEISRAGDVIPYLEMVLSTRTDEPLIGAIDNCPCCGSKVILTVGKTGSQTEYCPNVGCKDRRVAHLLYCTGRNALNIKGLGDELVLQLYEADLVDVNRPLSLLQLTKDHFLKMGQSDRMSEKLEMAVTIAKHNLDLTRVIIALGIDGCADGTAERLGRVIPSLDEISKATIEQMVTIPDIGDITAQSIFEFFNEDNFRPEAESVWKPYVGDLTLKAPEPLGTLFLPGTTFVVTGSKFGKLTRKELEAYFKKNGAKVSSTVTGSTTTVYCGTKYTAHKLATAKATNIPYVIYSDEGVIEHSPNMTLLTLDTAK